MPAGTDGQVGHFGYGLKNIIADNSVLFDLRKFLIRQTGGLVEYLLAYADLSDIMNQPHFIYLFLLGLAFAHAPCDLGGIFRNSAGMTVCVMILCVNGS